jgi:radical SAM protein with 4Fe4S-binding SPASM domain
MEYVDSDYAPNQVVFEITLKCNLKCLHCGSSAGNARENELNTKEILEVCKGLSEIGFKGIGLMGGEMFLREDWEAIVKTIKDHGMAVSTVTNGFFKPDKIIPKLVKLEVDCVTVGFDGTEKIHDQIRGVPGAFKKALEFMMEAKRSGLLTNAITTVHKLNFKNLNDLKKLILDEKNLDWQLQEVVPIGRFDKKLGLSEEELYSLALYIASLQQRYSKEKVVGSHSIGFFSKFIPNLSLYPEWKGCYAGRGVLGINSIGDVKGCEMLPDEYIDGNVREKNIVDIWNDPNAFAYNRQFKKTDLGPLCKDCEHGEKCMGGCMTRSVVITNKPHNDPHCLYKIEQDKKINF